MACMKVLLDLMLRTGYSIVQESRQRKFGPPPDWQGPPPAHGCEVFLGGIPRDLYEDELVPVLEMVGKLYQLRLMMDYSGETRGYAFATYATLAQATDAVKKLNKFEIRPGRRIGVHFSVDNRHLFIGALPKDKKRAEVMMAMSGATEGVVDVTMSVCYRDKTLNRGYAFIEYRSHHAAAMARRKLLRINLQLWGRTIKVDWAWPEFRRVGGDESHATLPAFSSRSRHPCDTGERRYEAAIGKVPFRLRPSDSHGVRATP
uniref:Probable RNA-binding protein 46 n=1 Tax=Petromyzon marinus TaxID=7757 RepID=A0AAJ7SIV9_PETMA|nr:probable RNA-binding protein 46 [Petromyzon marinus]